MRLCNTIGQTFYYVDLLHLFAIQERINISQARIGALIWPPTTSVE
jgi:hypothetical protein